ncbi:hypothetical protein H9P43_006219 [Blastocladiella emersonii ATCC 22665]|nr:hypothetical protein H9P43_006219 [Blastocladiella emersonii ATCC 22665]
MYRRHLAPLAVLALLAASVTASHSSVPVVAWRAHAARSAAPTSHVQTPAAGVGTASTLPSLLADAGVWSAADLCTASPAVVVFQHDNVHAVDLLKHRDHPAVLVLKAANEQSAASVEVAHYAGDAAADLAAAYTVTCDASADGAVRVVDLPALADEVADAKSPAAATVATTMAAATREFPDALFVYTGTWAAPAVDGGVEALAVSASPVTGGASGAITAKTPFIGQYRIFTPGFFMTLSVAVGLLLILLVGISWLASIKVPAGMEGSKRKPKTA